ncbi:MAG TPA: hypothetical protein VN457_04465, partial [Chlamydiales bacterium]|nr:hypothetical protein [Chlamydiales bacterium]
PTEETKLLLGIRGQPEPTAIQLNEKAYLTHDPRPHVARWSISPSNSPTPLFLEIEVKDGQIIAHLKMKDHEGKLIEEPYEFAHFVLPEMTPPVSHETLTQWRIGTDHVDGSILQRHKARWFGQDLFLQMYGGAEFAFTKECERLEFEENGRYYNIFIKPDDLIAFGDDGWEVVEAGKQSYHKPLLHVKKIDDASIAFDLWENDGKMKLFLELRKSLEPPFTPTLNDFKLVGARSRKDWIAEISGKRELIRDDDWILYSQGKYKRLTKVEDLDNYVEGVIRGELIVFEGVKRAGNEMCLTGVRFNEMRTQTSPVQIPVYKAPETQGIEPQLQQPHTIDADDDDDDDDEAPKHTLPNGMRDNSAPARRPGNA